MATDNLDTLTLPDGVVEDYDYDALNRLEKLTVNNASNKPLFEQTYTLAADGQRTAVIEKRFDGASADPFSKVRITWTYDALDRLIAETRDADTSPISDDAGDFGSPDTADGYSEAWVAVCHRLLVSTQKGG